MNTFSESRNIYIKKKPKSINVYAGLQHSCFLCSETIIYRFSFSEIENVREIPLMKNMFSNTAELFRYIIGDFINNKALLSMTYDFEKTKNNYLEIKLKNRNGESLNLYYTKKVSYGFEILNNLIQAKKYYDFYQYGKDCIDKGLVEYLYFYSSKISSINLVNKKSIIYNYRSDEENIDCMDQACIIALIRYFINFKLKTMSNSQEKRIEYSYSDIKKANASVNILINKKSYIRLLDPKLIDVIEKNGIFDEIYQCNQNDEMTFLKPIEEVEEHKLARIFKNKKSI